MQREAAIRVPLLMAALISPFAPEPPARKKITTFSGFVGSYFRCPKLKSKTTFQHKYPPKPGKKLLMAAPISPFAAKPSGGKKIIIANVCNAFTCRFLGPAVFLEPISLFCYFQSKSSFQLRNASGSSLNRESTSDIFDESIYVWGNHQVVHSLEARDSVLNVCFTSSSAMQRHHCVVLKQRGKCVRQSLLLQPHRFPLVASMRVPAPSQPRTFLPFRSSPAPSSPVPFTFPPSHTFSDLTHNPQYRVTTEIQSTLVSWYISACQEISILGGKLNSLPSRGLNKLSSLESTLVSKLRSLG